MYTEIHRGSFTSTGANKFIPLVTDVDWMNVYNMTAAAAGPVASNMIKFYWQRDMADNDAFMDGYLTGTAVAYTDTALHLGVGGFKLYNSSSDAMTSPIVFTNISNATPPVVLTGTTTGLVAGDIVRLASGVGVNQLMGIDFTVGTVVGATSFELKYAPTVVTAAAPGATAVWRKLYYDGDWYPKKRTIAAVTVGTSTIVRLTVTHGYVVGQKVRFYVPETRGSNLFGMPELNGLMGTVTAINTATNTITVDINSTGFTAFAYPLTAIDRFSVPQVIPVGEDSNLMANTVADDAILNMSSRGIILAAGASSPAGQTNDVIFWTAGKSNL
jgi:hypothetical protein